jgi:hypothetical protein
MVGLPDTRAPLHAFQKRKLNFDRNKEVWTLKSNLFYRRAPNKLTFPTKSLRGFAMARKEEEIRVNQEKRKKF